MFTIMLGSLCGMGYMPLGAPCDAIVSIVNHSDAA